MTHQTASTGRSILLRTDPHECAYVPTRTARLEFLSPTTPLDGHAYQRLLEQGEVSPPALARGVELCLARSLVACVQNAARRNEAAGGVLLVGGVASNRRIASFIREQVDLPVEVVEPKYAVDNAVGSALYACKKFRN